MDGANKQAQENLGVNFLTLFFLLYFYLLLWFVSYIDPCFFFHVSSFLRAFFHVCFLLSFLFVVQIFFSSSSDSKVWHQSLSTNIQILLVCPKLSCELWMAESKMLLTLQISTRMFFLSTVLSSQPNFKLPR